MFKFCHDAVIHTDAVLHVRFDSRCEPVSHEAIYHVVRVKVHGIVAFGKFARVSQWSQHAFAPTLLVQQVSPTAIQPSYLTCDGYVEWVLGPPHARFNQCVIVRIA